MNDQLELTSRYGMRSEEFSSLMQHRVREILLVASHYDAFVLEEDGQLTELVFEEYRSLDLNMRYAPRFRRATGAGEALCMLDQRKFDMVVATPRLPDMSISDFARLARERHPELAVCVLAAHAWDLPMLSQARAGGAVDWLFLWQGDVKALLAMIKQEEDRRNADHDVLEAGVQVIILVEDEVRFYSAYLPHIYTEVTSQTSRLMAEGLNLSHRLLRIRARPKILLAQTFEEAWELFERYSGNILGIISDVSFPRGGELDPEAGLELTRRVRERDPDVPVLLQSADRIYALKAMEHSADFLRKDSPNLLEGIRTYIQDHFGFGDFIFKMPDGTEVGRVHDMRELVVELANIPDESLLYHAQRNHFSAWLKARTEFELASLLRPRTPDEFETTSALRTYLIQTLELYLREIQRHVITDFDEERFDEYVTFAKIGSGSLGGKGRGLAFVQKLLAHQRLDFPGVEIAIPQTVVLASDIFEEFLEANSLRGLPGVTGSLADEEILDAFRRGRFPREQRANLARLLETIHQPLAVRSSSILEDSLYQPFAGVYATVMIPNSHASLDVRLAQLLEAVKVVYASTFFRNARDYLAGTPHRIEEERMAVLIQRLVGSRHGDLFYPTISGVASSYNFYPFGDMKPEDGVAQIALGLGKSVVDGFEALRFCPRYPQVLPQFSSTKDILRNAQRRFYALDMEQEDLVPAIPADSNLVTRQADEALRSGAASLIASTYVRADERIVSGVLPGGSPLVTFSQVLKGRLFPLPKILTRLLELASEGMGAPVEVEFAVDLGPGAPPVVNLLQIRPMVVEEIAEEIDLDGENLSSAVVFSESALGHGRGSSVADVVVVDPGRFDRARSAEAAACIESINRGLRDEGRNFVLIGPGRWGSQDPWLGIPVQWSQISAVRGIVEADFNDLEVEPSQGSHFFHNITCFGVSYFTVHEDSGRGSVNWGWLDRQPAVRSEIEGALRHLRLERPLRIVVDGSTGRGVILPGATEGN